MSSFRKLLFILTVFIILPAGLFAQAGSSEPGAGVDVIKEAAEDGFKVSIDLRLGGTTVGIVPGLSVLVGVPMSLSDDGFTLIPQVGFLYFFDVLTDIHSSYYIPVGIAAVYNPLNLGVELLYYPPVGVADGKHLLSATISGEAMLLETGGFSINFGVGLGPMFILNTAGGSVIFRINSAFLFRYRI